MFVVKSHFCDLLNLYICKVEVALDLFLHPVRVVLNFGMSSKLFSVYKVLERLSYMLFDQLTYTRMP